MVKIDGGDFKFSLRSEKAGTKNMAIKPHSKS
jgi:hypothetical protein